MPAPEFDPNQPFQAVDDNSGEKPEFDPNQDFKSADSGKPGFDPDQSFETPEEQGGVEGSAGLGFVEGLAQGLAGPIATGVETKIIGRKPEDIIATEEAHPFASAAGQLTGNVAQLALMPQIRAAKAIKGAIQMGVLAAEDEYSKWMLGHGNPIMAAGAHIVGAGALGLLLGGAGSIVETQAKKLAEDKAGSRLISYLIASGRTLEGKPLAKTQQEALQHLSESGVTSLKFHPDAYLNGQNFIKQTLIPAQENAVKYGLIVPQAAGIGAAVGGAAGSIFGPAGTSMGASGGGAAGTILGLKMANSLTKTVVPKINSKIAGPILTKLASSGSAEGIANALDYGATTYKGMNHISKGVDALFKSGSEQILDSLAGHGDNVEKKRDKLKDYLEQGGIDSELSSKPQELPQFASGGEVPNSSNKIDVVANNWPDQNMALTAAKSRISNYLKAQKPMQSGITLPYDNERKDHQKEREYNKVLDLANNPLSILKKIKNGSLIPKDMNHFKNLYPEIHEQLSEKITKKLVEHKIGKTKKPAYKTRQALSLFLGTNLESSLLPQNIMAAQGVFANQRAQKMNPGQQKASFTKINESMMTPEQGRTLRLNKG